jgi:hypothetical protein
MWDSRSVRIREAQNYGSGSETQTLADLIILCLATLLFENDEMAIQRRPRVVFLLILFLSIRYINTEMEFMKV